MAVLWAGGFISGKLIVQQAGPFAISFFRFLMVTLVLGALVYKREKDIVIDIKLFLYAFCAALIGIFFYNYLFFSGIKLVDAGRSSVIISTVPIVVAVVSFVLFKERMSVLKMLGIMISLVGAWIVISKGDWNVLASAPLGRGEVYLILCVFCAAAFALFSKELLQSLSPVVTMVYISAVGTVLLFIPALLEIREIPVEFFSAKFLLNLFYLAAGPSVVAVIFFYEAIHSIGTARASQYMNLIPVFAVMLAMIFLGETITASLVLGGGLVTAGLYLTNFVSS